MCVVPMKRFEGFGECSMITLTAIFLMGQGIVSRLCQQCHINHTVYEYFSYNYITTIKTYYCYICFTAEIKSKHLH